MRSGVVYFRFVAIVLIAFGLLSLIWPDQYISLLGADASVGGRLWGRAFGAVSLSFGVMFWMMDPSGDQRARRIGAIGAGLAFGLTGIGDVISLIAGDLPAYGWGFVAFNAVMVALALYYLLTPIPFAKASA